MDWFVHPQAELFFLKHPHVYFMITQEIAHTHPETCNSVENTGPDTIRNEAQASQLVWKQSTAVRTSRVRNDRPPAVPFCDWKQIEGKDDAPDVDLESAVGTCKS